MTEYERRFPPRRGTDVRDLIASHPLGWVVSSGVGGAAATLAPLLAETGGGGKVVSLLGHFARANRQVGILERSPRALILFQGENGYVSPRLVSKPAWAPTWNYASVWFETEVAFCPEETEAAVTRLAAALEAGSPSPWSPPEMGERLERLLPAIVAFRARVLATHAVFKLGQDEPPRTFSEIVEGLEDPSLARLMRDQVERP